jgi:hypothetical protein
MKTLLTAAMIVLTATQGVRVARQHRDSRRGSPKRHSFLPAARVVALLLGAVLVAWPAISSPDSFVEKSFADLVAEAEEIFVGTIVRAESRWAGPGIIVSDFSFLVHTAVKGVSRERAFVLQRLGGTVDGESMIIRGWPQLALGETYLLFVKGNGEHVFPVVGGSQGLFRILSDPASSTPIVRDARGGPLRSATVTAATGPAPTLDEFLRALELERDR